MRNLLLCILPLMLLFASCRKEHSVDFRTSPYYYYSIDSNKILYDNTGSALSSIFSKPIYEEVTVDVDAFEVLARKYGKDSKHIYYTYKALTNVHYPSFYWDKENLLPKDRKHVYLPTTETNELTVIKRADPKTYQKVSQLPSCLKWFVDKNHYFYNHEITIADRTTLSFESPYLPYDNKNIFLTKNKKVTPIRYKGTIVVIAENMIRDNKSFYYTAYCDSTSRCIEYQDSTSFKYYGPDKYYFGIDNRIYFMGIAIAADIIDIDSFNYIQYNYTKDKNNVYYKTVPIVDCDPKTFDVVSDIYTKDRKHVYKKGLILKGYKSSEFKYDDWGRLPTESGYGKSPRSRSKDDDDD